MSVANSEITTQKMTTPFSLQNESAYQQWREQKLQGYPQSAEELIVAVNNPEFLSESEIRSLLKSLRKTNMVIYRIEADTILEKSVLRQFGLQFGLESLDDNLCADEDSITSLQVVDEGRHREYIPYSNRRLSWHTDGYYNEPDRQIQSVVLHCVSPAAEGGENMLLDHEIAYLHLRDANPDYISALMHPQAMTIPANIEDGEEIRAEQTGPVFSMNKTSGNLHMRYSARKRNIVWREDQLTQDAVACLDDFLQSDSPYIYRYRLKSGEGLLSNNVLHNRTGFTDSDHQQRLLYRARYFDRIADTNISL